MGQLHDGVWTIKNQSIQSADGKFIRKQTSFRNWITADGSPGESGSGGFKAETGRYHLYVAYACPWAHRTLIFRALKGLEDFISISVVNWFMGENGWTFEESEGVIGDPINDARFLYQVYTSAVADYSGRVSVPVLWDKQTGTIVSNESSEIIRMLNSAFDDTGAKPGDYYPLPLRDEIDAVNSRVYSTVNNGVYRCGFATSQAAYAQAFGELFDTLDWLDERLSKSRYLVGDQITETDWRLFVTLVRFDLVYVGHFKCNLRRIADYPNLSGYVRDLYQHEGIAPTVHFDHIKNHYYASHESINPHRIVPIGPLVDFDGPHDRAKF